MKDKFLKADIFLFLTIMLSNIILIYPYNNFSTGNDSFQNIMLADTLIDNGFDKRIISVLSYFGMTPTSNSMGGLFVISTFCLLTDLDPEFGVLIINFIFAFLSVICTLTLASAITRDRFFMLSLVVLYCLSKNVTDLTQWTYSFRGLFRVLEPLAFFIIFKLSKELDYRGFVLGFLFFITLSSVHQQSFFFLFVFASVIVVKFVYPAFKEYSFSRTSLMVAQPLIILLILISIFSFGLENPYFDSENTKETGMQRFFDYDHILIHIINLLLLYSKTFGLLVVIAPLGYYYLLCNRFKSELEQSFLLTLIIISPFLIDITYVMGFSQIILAFFAAYGLKYLHEIFSKENISKILSVLIITIIQFSPVFLTLEDGNVTEDEVFSEIVSSRNTGLYYGETFPNIPLDCFLLNTMRVYAYSDEAHLSSEVSDYLRLDSLNGSLLFRYFTLDSKIIFDYDEPSIASLDYSLYSSDKQLYHPSHILSLKANLGDSDAYLLCQKSDLDWNFEVGGVTIVSNFSRSVNDQNYKVYENNIHSIKIFLI